MHAIRLGHEAWENSSDVLNNLYSSLYEYSRMTSIKSPTFCMTTFSASLTNLTACLPQSHDRSSCVSVRTLAPPPIWLQKQTDLRAHEFAHSPDLWHQPRLANVTCPWSWGLCGINHAMWCSLAQRGVRGQWSVCWAKLSWPYVLWGKTRTLGDLKAINIP
jgi:hypothetical protein